LNANKIQVLSQINRSCPEAQLESWKVPEFIVCFEHGILHWVVQQNSPVVTLVEVAGFLAPLGRFVPSTTTKEAGTPWQRISLVGKHLKRTSLNLQHSVVTQWLLSGCWDGFCHFFTTLWPFDSHP